MADATDRVSIELIDAGEHKDRVIQVLSKVKGISMLPEQIVANAPCTVAANVPRHLAEKLQGFLEQVGAMVLLESEEELFSPSALPSPGPEEEEAELLQEEMPAPPEEEGLAKEFPALSEEELFGESGSGLPPESPPEIEAEAFERGEEVEEEKKEEEEEEEGEKKKEGKLQKIVSFLSGFKTAKKREDIESQEAEAIEETEKKIPKKGFSLPFLSKFRKSEQIEAEQAEEGAEQISPIEEGVPQIKKVGVLMPAIIGFLVGAIIMGGWGWFAIRAVQRKGEQEMIDYEQRVAEQIEEHSAELKNLVNQLSSESENLRQKNAEFAEMVRQLSNESTELKQKNAELGDQVKTLTAQLEETRQQQARIVPSQIPDPGGLTPSQETLIQKSQELIALHTQSLENSYEVQKQASCSKQILYDGSGTYTYAQVVKQFSAKYTKYDIMRGNSLLSPYVAELKIPFWQEMRTGKTEKACDNASLQKIETPDHHEFGSYYGYWIIQYEYKDGKWVVNPTIIEKNRALYESAFQKGSPDFAKFRIDLKLFPEFKTQ